MPQGIVVDGEGKVFRRIPKKRLKQLQRASTKSILQLRNNIDQAETRLVQMRERLTLAEQEDADLAIVINEIGVENLDVDEPDAPAP